MAAAAGDSTSVLWECGSQPGGCLHGRGFRPPGFGCRIVFISQLAASHMRRATFILPVAFAALSVLLPSIVAAQDGPGVGDDAPLVDFSQWANGSPVLLSDFRQNKVVLLWFFCQ